MPTYRIIVLEREQNTQRVSYRYALWVDVPAGREQFYANPEATSAFVGISGSDLLAIQNGQVLEKVELYSKEQGTPIAVVQAALESRWQQFQDYVTNTNQLDRYGTTWDGSTWSPGGF